MINLFWLMYIVLMLYISIVSIVIIVDERNSYYNRTSLTVVIIFTCLLWAGFIVYYLN